MRTLMMKAMGLYLNVLSVVAPRKAARVGFDLFCFPFRSPVSDRHKAFLNSAERSDLMHRGTRIQCYRWGHGPRKILFLHGWRSHSYRWKSYIDTLGQDDYSLYAFDAPGHGLSGGKYLNVKIYSDVIRDFIAEAGPLDAIISHSVGSFSAIFALHLEPGMKVQKLVTLASPGEASEFFDFYERMLGLSQKTKTLVAGYFKQQIGIVLNDFSAPVFASSLKIPGLVIHDEEDRETGVYHSRRIHAAWTGSRLVVTKGFGHNLKSETVIHEVTEFVKHTGEMEIKSTKQQLH